MFRSVFIAAGKPSRIETVSGRPDEPVLMPQPPHVSRMVRPVAYRVAETVVGSTPCRLETRR